MSEMVFHSVEELREYLRSVPDDVIVKITVEEGSEVDAETGRSHAASHE